MSCFQCIYFLCRMPSSLLELPDDIFERLFLYLNAKDVLRFEATSTKSYHLSAVYYWHHFTSLNLVTFLRCNSRIDVTNAYKFDSAAAGLIKRAGPVLKYLNLSKFGPLEYGLRLGLEVAVIEHCRTLHTLELNNRLLDREWLLQVCVATSQLKCLSMNHVYLRNYGELDDKHLSEALQGWDKLENLSVRDNKALRLSCYSDLPLTLLFLDVQGCSLSLLNLQELLKRCQTLETLCITYPPGLSLLDPTTLQNIKRLEVDSACTLIGEDQFSKGLSSLINLRCLTVCSHMTTDILFKTIARYLINIEEISFPGAKRGFVTSATFALLELSTLPQLKKIGLRGNILGRNLLMLCYKFGSLTEIDVSYAVKERDLIDAWEDIKSNVLEVLIMKGFCPPTQDTREVAKRVMNSLKDTCPSLMQVVI